MLTPLILLIVLMGTTAFIAHWSDNLGKKLGKKRVSLFGLRPRQTATLLTIVSSWAIMLITLAALLIIFAPLRNALFRYDKERAANQRLQESTKDLRDQTRRLAQRVTDASEQLDTARENASKARQDLTQSRQLAVHAEKARSMAQASEDKALKGAKQATAREQSARQRENAARVSEQQARKAAFTAKQGEVASEKLASAARSSLSLVRGSLASTQQRLGQIRQRLQQTDFKFAQANQRVQNAQQQLRFVNANLKIAQNDATLASQSASIASKSAFDAGKKALEAYKQVDEAKLQVAQAQSEVKQLTEQRVALQSDIDELSRYAEGLSQEATLLASGDVRVSINQTLAESRVEKGRSAAEIQVTLRETLENARRVLPKVLPGVTLNLLPLPIRAGDKDAYLAGDAIFSELARFIISRDEDVAVRLLATRNFSSRESTISGRFVIVPIRTVFSASRVLAETTIDGKNSRARIFNAFLQLVENGQAVAAKAGVTPPQSLEAPNFFAPDTNERIFEAIERVQAVGGLARVKMVVAADTTTVDAMQVRFEVEIAPRKTI